MSCCHAAPTAPMFAGLYTDGNHYQEGTFAGLRCVSSPRHGQELYIIGSDDGKTWWTVEGKIKDKEKGEILVDFSAKGGPKFKGVAEADQISWENGHFWVKEVSAETLNIPFQAADKDPGGLYNDPNHYEKDSVVGIRFVSIKEGDTTTDKVTIIITNDGTTFETVFGTYAAHSGKMDVDFSLLGGPGSLKATYSKGRINWDNGHVFYNMQNELNKLIAKANPSNDVHMGKRQFLDTLSKQGLCKEGCEFEIFGKALEAYRETSKTYRDVKSVLSGEFNASEFIEYVKGTVDLIKDGIMKHPEPELKYFEPRGEERDPLYVKEIKLPAAAETHEVFFDPVTRYVFVAQMAESVLVRAHMAENGFLDDHLDCWYVGEIDKASGKGVSGLHNLSSSYRYPGHVWASIQFANQLLLIDAETMQTRMILSVPTVMTLADGTIESIGGPHCIRECPLSGDIWVCLKGPLACNPVLDKEEIGDHHGGRAARQAAMKRPCCSPDTLKHFMKAHHTHKDSKYSAPHPAAYAMWRVNPRDYDPDSEKEGCGGYLYPVEASPPMCAIDRYGNCWVAQDRNPLIAVIDPKTNVTTQLTAPCPKRNALGQSTGPGIGMAPDGSIWCALLGGSGAVLRCNPETKQIIAYELGREQWAKAFRVIHFDFDIIDREELDGTMGKRYLMYMLSSSLLDHGGINAIMVLRFDETWTKVLAKKIVPLPTQNCACHRIFVVGRELEPEKRAVVVTELTMSKLVMLQTHHLHMQDDLTEEVYPVGEGQPFEFRYYYNANDPFEKQERLEEKSQSESQGMLSYVGSALTFGLMDDDEDKQVEEAKQLEYKSAKDTPLNPSPSPSKIEGIYKDPNHYQEGTLSGLRMISSSIGDKFGDTLTLIGSDDGTTFWTVSGKMRDHDSGEFLVDFSPKGGPKLNGVYADGTITWKDGGAWTKITSVDPLKVPFQAGDKDPGGLYNDANHFEVDTFAGVRFAALSKDGSLTLIICNDGLSFWTVKGKYSKGEIDMDFSVLGGPKSLTAKYENGRINWSNGHCFFNLHKELEKVRALLDPDGDKQVKKTEIIAMVKDPKIVHAYPFFNAPLKTLLETWGHFRIAEDSMSSRYSVDDFISYLVASLELTTSEGYSRLKHAPPNMKYFQPRGVEKEPVIMKEVRLPHAAETHEVYFDPVTRYVFVAQMSESVLVRIHVDESGFLTDHQDAYFWGVVDPETKRGLSGLHNLSQSYAYPGYMWATLQFANLCLLVDCETLKTRQIIKVPTRQTLKDGSQVKIGGPHCVRECPLTGDIWVALKGAVPCNPILGTDEVSDHKGGQAARDESLKRPCCSPDDLKKFMESHHEHESEEFDAPLPDAYAVWRVNPKEYDPEGGEAKGGKLFACEPSPPMVAIDSEGNCWVAQDRTPKIGFIGIEANEIKQIDTPVPVHNALSPATGPGIGRAPDGAVWCAMLGGDSCLLRLDPNTGKAALYEFGRQLWCQALRIIHFDFEIVEFEVEGEPMHINFMYCIASSLVDHDAINALVILRFDCTWTHITARRTIPLPTQNCACHRVQVIGNGRPLHERAVIVSELATSRLLEIKTQHIRMNTHLVEHMEPADDECPYDRHFYFDPSEGGFVELLAEAKKIGGSHKAVEILRERQRQK